LYEDRGRGGGGDGGGGVLIIIMHDTSQSALGNPIIRAADNDMVAAPSELSKQDPFPVATTYTSNNNYTSIHK